MLTFESFGSSSSGCCYRVSSPGIAPILLDCGLPFKQLQRALGFKVSELAGCCISHAHQDHCKSVFELAAHGIDCYADPRTWRQMDEDKVEAAKPHIKGLLTSINAAWPVGDWSVMPFEAEHDCLGTVGFFIGPYFSTDRLLYLTDSVYSKFKFEKVTHLAVECNHDVDIVRKNVQEGIIPRDLAQRILRTHMSIQRLEEMCRVMDKSKLQHIYLLHLSAANSHATEFKERIERCTGVPVTVCAERMAV